MGPYNELKQLKRAAAVSALLDKQLSPWARNYWTRVLQELATSEEIYNYRVKSVYHKRKRVNL
jgi:hypothetical protein